MQEIVLCHTHIFHVLLTLYFPPFGACFHENCQGNVVVFTAAVASVSLTRIGRLKAGSAGWGLTQALSITGLLTWAVRCLTDLETNMMSVMRVKELTDLDSEEPDLRSLKSESKSTRRMPKEVSEAGDSLKPLFADGTSFNATLAPLNSSALAADGWPWCGNVLFRNVSMRYNPTAPLVLDRVTLSVPPGTTLGKYSIERIGWNTYGLKQRNLTVYSNFVILPRNRWTHW